MTPKDYNVFVIFATFGRIFSDYVICVSTVPKFVYQEQLLNKNKLNFYLSMIKFC